MLGFNGYQLLNNEKPIENENPFHGDLIDQNEKCWIQFKGRQREFQEKEKGVKLRRNIKRKENQSDLLNVKLSSELNPKKRPVSWIATSQAPKPYQRKDSDSNASLLCGLQEYRRKRSSEIIETDNFRTKCTATSYPDDLLRSRISQTPINISKNQKLLKTGMLSRQGGPLFHEKLELNLSLIHI